MRRWHYAASGALVAAILLVGSGAEAQPVGGCERIRETPPILYHGTAAEGFSHAGQARDTWRFPDGPAWLGIDPEFSVHAAMRLAANAGQVTLFAYSGTIRPLHLVSCETADQAAAYAVRVRGLAAGNRQNDNSVAAQFCSVDYYPILDGYRIAADRVRGQIEYIICSPSRVFPVTGITYSFWNVIHYQLRSVRGRLAAPGTGRQAHYFLADLDEQRGIDLTCFVRLPQTDEGSCSAATKPRLDCCKPPLPPRSHQ